MCKRYKHACKLSRVTHDQQEQDKRKERPNNFVCHIFELYLTVGKLFYCERCFEVEVSWSFYKWTRRKNTNNEHIKGLFGKYNKITYSSYIAYNFFEGISLITYKFILHMTKKYPFNNRHFLLSNRHFLSSLWLIFINIFV